jgi:hypothetical protein
LIEVVAHKEHKPHHVHPGDILVDDYDVNTKAWEEAGGISILFENSIQAIIALNKHIQADTQLFEMALSCARNNTRIDRSMLL